VNQYYEKNLTTGVVTASYYLGSKLIAQREGTTLRYVHQDSLSGTSVMSDSGGTSVGTIKYYPFGATKSGSVPTDKKFTGQRLDQSGLYYYNARYYDAGIGRFISPDTVSPNQYEPQTWNRYSYCFNNPLAYNDPTGNWPPFVDKAVSWVDDKIVDPVQNWSADQWGRLQETNAWKLTRDMAYVGEMFVGIEIMTWSAPFVLLGKPMAGQVVKLGREIVEDSMYNLSGGETGSRFSLHGTFNPLSFGPWKIDLPSLLGPTDDKTTTITQPVTPIQTTPAIAPAYLPLQVAPVPVVTPPSQAGYYTGSMGSFWVSESFFQSVSPSNLGIYLGDAQLIHQ